MRESSPLQRNAYDRRRPRISVAMPAMSAIALAPEAGSISGEVIAAIVTHCIPTPSSINDNIVRIFSSELSLSGRSATSVKESGSSTSSAPRVGAAGELPLEETACLNVTTSRRSVSRLAQMKDQYLKAGGRRPAVRRDRNRQRYARGPVRKAVVPANGLADREITMKLSNALRGPFHRTSAINYYMPVFIGQRFERRHRL